MPCVTVVTSCAVHLLFHLRLTAVVTVGDMLGYLRRKAIIVFYRATRGSQQNTDYARKALSVPVTDSPMSPELNATYRMLSTRTAPPAAASWLPGRPEGQKS